MAATLDFKVLSVVAESESYSPRNRVCVRGNLAHVCLHLGATTSKGLDRSVDLSGSDHGRYGDAWGGDVWTWRPA
jgi:hypothetical protein